ncbi:ATP synthase F1 subunit delta [Floccifex sp.]|uniref:ATP synthase F1 subunit delta n=1 Tax=Floccifex sp. TaxID=2815810 RepID=UPI002A74E9DD|nr:ATP synthase F1 subunit delta [Floccifex sp.]
MALFELASSQGKEKDYMDSLKELSSIWNENKDFRLALRHPKITREQKREWISNLFENKLDSLLYRFLLVMVEHDLIGFIPELYEAYVEVYKESQNIESVYVESAMPLTQETIEDIKKVIESKLNKNIEITTNVNPELIAGIRVRTKDYVLDNSMLSRINNLKEKLSNTN